MKIVSIVDRLDLKPCYSLPILNCFLCFCLILVSSLAKELNSVIPLYFEGSSFFPFLNLGMLVFYLFGILPRLMVFWRSYKFTYAFLDPPLLISFLGMLSMPGDFLFFGFIIASVTSSSVISSFSQSSGCSFVSFWYKVSS